MDKLRPTVAYLELVGDDVMVVYKQLVELHWQRYSTGLKLQKVLNS
jgi:hypothetical protein